MIGNKKWAVLPCRFSDVRMNIYPPGIKFLSDLKDCFENAFNPGVFRYFQELSLGRFDPTGSKVFDWLDLNLSAASQPGRAATMAAALTAAAQAGINLAPYEFQVVLVNAAADSGAITGAKTILLHPKDFFSITLAAHELGHAFGLNDSWSEGPPATPYGDPFDIMSAETFGGTRPTFTDPRFASSGPGISVPNLLWLEWITPSEVFQYANGVPDVKLVPLDVQLSGWPDGVAWSGAHRAIKIPLSGDAFLTVEFRVRSGWDKAIAADCVVIHRVTGGNSYLISNATSQRPFWVAGENYFEGSRGILVQSIDVRAFGVSTATIALK